MGAVFIGGIVVFLKFKPPGTHSFQQSPIGFIFKFGEVTDRILRLGDCRALVTAGAAIYRLVQPISRLHRAAAGSWILAVTLDAHGSGEACAIAIQVKLPPSVIAPISVIVSFVVIITVP